ncbi:PorV/PorQ family protein [Elusimicrobiota bacterium]
MCSRLKTVIFLIIFTAFGFSVALAAGAGRTGAEFLLINPGARAAAMGNAFVAVADNIEAVFWNPAGLASMKMKEVSATHAKWLDDIAYESLGYGHHIPGYGTLGVSALYLHMGEMEGRSRTGQETGDFNAYDMSVSLSFGRAVLGNLSVGTNVKYIRQNIEDESASGIAVDLGGLYEVKGTRLMLGGALQNIGPKMKFVKEKYSLPLTLNFGVGYRFGLAVLALDIKRQLIEEHTSVSIGTEYCPVEFFALRGGYLVNLLGEGIGNTKTKGSGISDLGAGLGLKLSGLQFDYAFVPFADLGNTHRISFAGKF